MNNISELKAGEQIVKYKSRTALLREYEDISAWFEREWGAVDRVANVAKALIGGGNDVLAKAASADLATARSDIEALKKRYAKECERFGDSFVENLALGHRMATVLTEYNRRIDAHKADEKRSRRFNEAFAAPLGGRVH